MAKKKKKYRPWRSFLNEVEDDWKHRVEVSRQVDSTELLAWGKKYFPEVFRSEFNQIHRHIQDEMLSGALVKYSDRKRRRQLSLIAPRGSAKSTILTFLLPIYSVCHSLEKYILIASATLPLAKQLLSDIVEQLQNNKTLIKDYPHAAGVGPVTNRDNVITKNNVYLDTVGVMTSLRGRRKFGWRPTLIIFDDPERDNAKTSQLQRRKTRSWFNQALQNTGSDCTTLIVAGTVLHRDCLVCYIERNKPTFYSSRFRAVLTPPENEYLWKRWRKIIKDGAGTADDREAKADAFYDRHRKQMDKGYKTVWPEVMTPPMIEKKKLDIGLQSFEQEYQGKASAGVGYFGREDIARQNLVVDAFPKALAGRWLHVDPSMSSNEAADHVAITDLAKGFDGRFYARQVISHVKPLRLASMIVDLIESALDDSRPYQRIELEGNGFQKLLSIPIANAFETKNNERVKGGLQKISAKLYYPATTTNKELRIRSLDQYLASATIKLVDSPSVEIMINQLEDFPNTKRDDGLDSLALALLMSKRKRKQ